MGGGSRANQVRLFDYRREGALVAKKGRFGLNKADLAAEKERGKTKKEKGKGKGKAKAKDEDESMQDHEQEVLEGSSGTLFGGSCAFLQRFPTPSSYVGDA